MRRCDLTAWRTRSSGGLASIQPNRSRWSCAVRQIGCRCVATIESPRINSRTYAPDMPGSSSSGPKAWSPPSSTSASRRSTVSKPVRRSTWRLIVRRRADLFGGPVAVSITCQVLPPGWFGYEPYCPYTTHPDPGGRWQAPDLSAARELVAASGTAGAGVHVGPFRARHAPLGDHLASVLNDLGYEVTVDLDTDDDHVYEMLSSGAMQVGAFEFSYRHTRAERGPRGFPRLSAARSALRCNARRIVRRSS